MPKRVSMTDVAKRAGVSTSTVSHILNNTRYVSPEITQRVKRAVEETGYRQNMLARAMRRGKTNTIGIIIPKINPGHFYGQALSEIEACLGGQGYRLLIQASGDDPVREQEAVQQLLEWNVDGILLVPSDNDYDYSVIPCPVVLMDREIHLQTVSGFYVDNYGITCQAMRRLIGCGHRRIGFVGAVPRFAPTVNRVRGYRDTLAEAGLPVEEALICCDKATQEAGERLTRQLVERERVTAVLIGSSPMTVGGMRYINASGIRVPEQLAIVSFANYEWTPLCNPPLDGIVQPNREIGRCAAEKMLALLRQPENEPVVTQLLPCTYVAGGSVEKNRSK